MTARPVPEIVADLREWCDDDPEFPDEVAIHGEAADLIEALVAENEKWEGYFNRCDTARVEVIAQRDALLALLPDCPVCGGTGGGKVCCIAPPRDQDCPGDFCDCPNVCTSCSDGKVTVAQMAAQLAAVHAALDTYDAEVNLREWGRQPAIDCVSAIAKAVRS